MSKAIDNTNRSTVVTTVLRSPSWSPGYVGRTDNTSLFTATKVKRPDTIYNKPNMWGFRAMSAWSRTWLQIAAPEYTFETKVKPGYEAWFEPKGSHVNVTLGLVAWNEVGLPSALSKLRASGSLQFSVENQAKTRVLTKVSQKKWDLGVFAIELKETIGLADSLARDVAKAYRKIAPDHSPFKGLSRLANRIDKVVDAAKRSPSKLSSKETDVLNRFADRWMEYTFGIKPALYDVQDASEALATQIGRPLIAFAKAGASLEERQRVSTIPTNCKHRILLDKVTSFAIHYSLLFESGTEGVSPLTTLGLDQPGVVAWEALPYSWMVDYVIGIGDWLNTWNATQGLRLKSGCKSMVWRGHFEVIDVELLYNDITWAGRGKPNPLLDYRGGEFTRELLSSFPTPAVAPNLKQTVGGFQLANSLFALKNLMTLVPKR